MTSATIFSIANTAALLSWIVLAVAPRWSWTRRIILSGAMSLLFSVVYLILVIAFFGQAEGDFNSLDGVAKLFSDKNVVLTGWIHYLAFDLFVGAWEVGDAQEKRISHWFVLPCLVLTFMLGPIGFLLYRVVRFIVLRTRKGDFKNE